MEYESADCVLGKFVDEGLGGVPRFWEAAE